MTLYCINKAISAFILLYLTNLARKKERSQISSIDSLRAMALARKKKHDQCRQKICILCLEKKKSVGPIGVMLKG